jgi:hypothetical protein
LTSCKDKIRLVANHRRQSINKTLSLPRLQSSKKRVGAIQSYLHHIKPSIGVGLKILVGDPSFFPLDGQTKGGVVVGTTTTIRAVAGTVGVASVGAETTRVVVAGAVIAGAAPIGAATAGATTTGAMTVGVVNVGAMTSGEMTTRAAAAGAATARVVTTGATTARVVTTRVVAAGVATAGAMTTREMATGTIVKVEVEKSVATRVGTKHYFIYFPRATTIESAKVGCDCRGNKTCRDYRNNSREKKLGYI